MHAVIHRTHLGETFVWTFQRGDEPSMKLLLGSMLAAAKNRSLRFDLMDFLECSRAIYRDALPKSPMGKAISNLFSLGQSATRVVQLKESVHADC